MRTISKTAFVMFGLFALVGTASAGDDKAGKKAPPPDPVAIKPAEPPAPPPIPEPAPELLAFAKKMKGTWKCKADMFMPDGTSYKNSFTMKMALDLDSMFVKGAFAEAKKKGIQRPYKFTSYTTFDGTKWHQMSVNNMGGWAKSWSTGPDAAGKVTWEGTSTMGGQDFKVRDFEEWTDKKTFHVWGEGMFDGKTYTKMYDATCKK